MALNIKDPAIHALARELAQTTGRRQSSGGCQPRPLPLGEGARGASCHAQRGCLMMLWCWRVGARWPYTASRSRPVAQATRRENPVSGRTVGSTAVAPVERTVVNRTHHSLHESSCTRL